MRLCDMIEDLCDKIDYAFGVNALFLLVLTARPDQMSE